MKRLYLLLGILSILLLCLSANAGIKMIGGGFGSTYVASGSDDCSGDLNLSWYTENIDVTVGGGCSSGDDEASPNNSVTLETVDGHDAIYANASQEYYQLDNSGTDIIDDEDGKITFWLYVETFEAESFILFDDATGMGDNSLSFNIQTASGTTDCTGIDVKVTNKRGGTSHTVVGSDFDIPCDTWVFIEYKWIENAALDKDHYLRACTDENCGTPYGTPVEEDDNLGAAVNFTYGRFGITGNTVAGVIAIRDIKIYGASGY